MKKFIYTFAAAVALPTIACASTSYQRITIIGDRIAAGSADTTIVDDMTSPLRAHTWASGVFLTPGQAPGGDIVPYINTATERGAQTAIAGITQVFYYCPPIYDGYEDIYIYDILSIDKPISEWEPSDLDVLGGAIPSKWVFWMQGARDVEAGTTTEEYESALRKLLEAVPHDVNITLVQPANGGAVFARRPLSDEYAMPNVAVEQAMLNIGQEQKVGNCKIWNVIPSYQYNYDAEGVAPIAADMIKLGRDAIEKGSGFEPNIVKAENNSITIGKYFYFNQNSNTSAPNAGFEIWRGTGKNARRLNITDVSMVDYSYIKITANERLLAGDVLIYGTSEPGIGKHNGRRGSLIYNSAYPCPIFSLTIDDVVTTGANITGTITCNGAGVPGVQVSDGYDITQTDANGHYSLVSDKRLGYVFYTLPSGYEPAVADNGWEIKHYALLDSEDKATPETHDFALTRVDNTHHIMIVGADAHIAARNSDKSQFKKGFISSVKKFVAAHPNTKIYSTILGDMSWDQYWYANNFALPDFKQLLTDNAYPLKLFPVMGNHDNDGATPASSQTDFLAAKPFRQTMAPTYYSYNLGKVHYVVLDDVVYKNTFTAGKTYSENIAGDRDYGKYYTDEQLEWLRRDLAAITDKSTPIVVCFHIQNWVLSTNGQFSVSAGMENSAADNLARVLADFSDVHLLSGHTHYNYHAHPPKYPNIHENNVAGICATWWWTGKLVDRHICKDGSPGGYAVYDADGKNLTWKYRSSEDDSEPQMRIYDMNAVKKAYKEDADIQAWIKHDATQTNYGTIADNTVYINVFNYDTDWKIEATEGDTPVTATRITAQDPLHVLCYEVPRYKAAATVTADFVTNKTNHMFMLKCSTANEPIHVRLTDSHGNVYESSLNRPGTYSTDM